MPRRWIWDLYNDLVDEENEPDAEKRNVHRRRWRLTVANTLVMLVSAQTLVLLAMFFALPVVGSLVWARDIDGRLSGASTEIREDLQTELDALRAELKASKDEARAARDQATLTYELLHRKLVDDTITKIIDYKSRQCAADNLEARQTWRALVLEYQQKYVDLTKNSRFPEPACSDL